MMHVFKKHRLKIIFFAILVVAIFFRFYNLSLVPPSASMDEVSIGWNAYSLLQTGHDEYGYRFPILLRAYDDYRPAFYVYLVIPFVKMFGLSVFAVRLPSVIMSTMTVIMSFFLIRSMFYLYKKKDSLAICAMALMAISPWHIYISRLGHEVNLGLTIVVFAALLFFQFVEHKKGNFLLASFAIFAVGFYSYQSEKLFIPLFVVMLLMLFRKQVLAAKKQAVLGILFAVIIALPMVMQTLSPTGLIRLTGTSVFTNNSQYADSAKQLLLAKQQHNVVSEILANRRITTVKIFVENYFSHFNPWWLFTNPGSEPFKAPNSGLLYVWELPFVVIGIFLFLLSKEIPITIKTAVVGWVLIDFLPPGITNQAPHALRALTVLPMPALFSAFGILTTLSFLFRKTGIVIGGAFLFLLSMIVMQSVFAFSHNYFDLFPVADSQSFGYALSKAVPFIASHQLEYGHVVVSNRKNLRQSYMFYLFYTKYDPKKYAAAGGTKSGGFAETHSIDNITFRPIDWEKETKSDTLYVGNPDDFPGLVGTMMTFYSLRGTPRVRIIGKN